MATNTAVVTLACTQCKERNYSLRRGVKKAKEKLDIKKFCSRCRKRTAHKVVK